MKLRNYQSDAVAACYDKWKEFRKILVACPTGSGKTIIFSHIAAREHSAGRRTLILAHRDELIRQAQDKLKEATGLDCAIEKAQESAIDSSCKIVVGSVQTLMREKRRERFAPDYFSLIVVDEAHHCWPFNTKILTLEGWQAIGEIVEQKKKVLVASVSLCHDTIEWKPITNWFRNKPKTLLRITHEHGHFTCTEDHKIWADRSYVRAKNIIPGMGLRMVRKTVQTNQKIFRTSPILFQNMSRKVDGFQTRNESNCLGQEPKTTCRKKMRLVQKEIRTSVSGKISVSFLLSRLCTNMESCKASHEGVGAGKYLENAQSVHRHEATGYIVTNEAQQPYEKSRDFTKDETVNGRENVPESWRKWKTYKGTVASILKTSVGICDGTSNQDGKGQEKFRVSSELLQSGHRSSIIKDSNRSRRKDSQTEKVEVFGSSQNFYLKSSRVVSVEVFKSRSDGESSFSGGKNQCLYDIEVADNHNYFADGVLVSNCIADSYQRILNYFSNARVCGFTATPERGDRKNLGRYFDALAYEYNLRQAIDDGWLCRIVAKTHPLKIDLSKVRVTAGDYNEKDLGNALDPYLPHIAKAIPKDRKTLIFTPLCITAQKLQAILKESGHRAYYASGKDRSQMAAWEADGPGAVMLNSQLLNEGYDHSVIDCVVVLRATKSRPYYAQMIGRGTRKHPGKENLMILDFLWQTTRHDLCHPCSLIAESPEVAEKMVKRQDESADPMDLEFLEEQAKRDVIKEREEALARELREQRYKKSRLIDPLAFAVMIKNEGLSNYEPVFAWEEQPPSFGQLTLLRRFGINSEKVKTKGYAKHLIGCILGRSKRKMATPGQSRTLSDAGYYTTDMTKVRANEILNELSANYWRVKF